jgi:peroxiredoxin
MERLPDESFVTTRDAFANLVALRGKMSRAPRTEAVELTEEERAMLKESLPSLEKTITPEPLTKIVRAAASELRLQGGRADALAELTNQYTGAKVGKFSLAGLGQDALSSDDLQGKVTVLHFWSYRDTPLQEPYGQVGYLEFLHTRRKDAGMRLFGVAVDSRLKQLEEQRGVTSSVRKLKSFMNLSYPILLDGGDLIKQFGDPRVLGAELPLFVVIGRDGKIVHYHSGFYDVDRQAGLKELDAAVAAALRTKPADAAKADAPKE